MGYKYFKFQNISNCNYATDLKDIPNEAELGLEKNHQRIFFRYQYLLSYQQKSFSINFLMGNQKMSNLIVFDTFFTEYLYLLF